MVTGRIRYSLALMMCSQRRYPIAGARILLITDAPTSESEGSAASLRDTAQALTVLRADVRVVSMRSEEKRVVNEIRSADLVFLTTHGHCGEDGSLSVLLEILGAPHTGPSSAVHALCSNKAVFRLLARGLDIRVPDINYVDLGPRVVKPVSGGGSQGVHYEADGVATKTPNASVIVEEFIDGTFVTCAVFPWVHVDLPLLEIRHDGPIFLYSSKRNSGCRQEICPASITEDAECEIRGSAKALYQKLGPVVHCGLIT